MTNDIEITVRDVVDKIGRDKLAKELGLENAKSIQPAVTRGVMPASWYPIVMNMSAEQGIKVPTNLFKWKLNSTISDEHTAA